MAWVKITAQVEGQQPNVGTGFIVRLEKDVAHIVTAAHIVSGDSHPQVEFLTKRDVPVSAEVFPGASSFIPFCAGQGMSQQ